MQPAACLHWMEDKDTHVISVLVETIRLIIFLLRVGTLGPVGERTDLQSQELGH